MALKREYYAASALSSSGIKKMLQSPEHFYTWKTRPFEKTAKALILGELMHYWCLTPELMKDEIAIFTKGKSLSSKKGEEFIEDHPGHFCCTQEQWDFAEMVASKVLKNQNVVDLLKRPEVRNEHEIYTSVNGVKCKALLDQLCPEYVLDVKTSSDDGAYFKKADSFKDKFFKLGYDIQGAWYQKMAELIDGIQREVIFLVIEMEAPFGVKIVQPYQTVLNDAWEECEKTIELYKECTDSGIWPGYEFKIDYVDTPSWRKKKKQREEETRGKI